MAPKSFAAAGKAFAKARAKARAAAEDVSADRGYREQCTYAIN